MKRSGERAVQILLVFMMMAGTVLAFYEQIENGPGSFSFWCCLAGFAGSLVWYGSRPGMKKGRGWLLFILGILAAAWYFRTGWQIILARIFELYENYYGIKIPLELPFLLPDTFQAEGALWTLGALSGVGAAYGVTGRRKQMLFLIQLPLLLLLLLLLGGVVPSLLPAGLWFLAVVGGLFYQRLLKGSSRSEVAEGIRFFCLFLGGAAALFLFASAVKAPVYDSIKANRQTIEKKIGSFQDYRWDRILRRLRGEDVGGGGRKASMGVSGGQIGQVEELVPGDGTDLVLTWLEAHDGTEEPGPEESGLRGEIYIRAFASGSYEDGNWGTPSLKEEDSSLRDTWQEGFLLNPLPTILGGNQETGMAVKDRVSVAVMNADKEYLYVPGLAASSEAADYRNRNYAVWADGVKGRELIWEVFRLRQSESAEAFLRPDVRAALSIGDRERTVLNLSDTLVRGSYLEVPEILREPLDSLLLEAAAARGRGSSIHGDMTGQEEWLLDLVREILWDRAFYTYQPGAVPEGEDLILWFLTENGKGYCTHFASAGVMLFRMLGIPARYCEGYKVMGSGERQIEVKNRNAHAWVEIYLAGCGWVPVEVTPGYVGRAAEEMTGPEPESETEPEEIPEPEPETAPSKPKSGWNGKTLTGAGVRVVGIAAAAGLFLFLRDRHRGKKRSSHRRSRSRKWEIEWYIRNRKQIEKEYRGRISWDTPPGAASETEASAGTSLPRRSALSPEEEEALERLYEEAVFSDHKLREESVSFAADCYKKTLRFYGARLSGGAGILFRLRYRKRLKGGARNE